MSTSGSNKIQIDLDSGAVTRITSTPVRNPTQVLQTLTTAPPVPVHLSKELSVVYDKESSSTIVIHRMPCIQLNANWYTMRDDEWVVPFTIDEEHPGPIFELDVQWTPDKSVVIPMFFLDLRSSLYQYLFNTAYLAFVDRETHEFYTPPLPNVYENGQLCTGDIPVEKVPDIMTAFEDIYSQWTANKWNTDLYDGWKYQFREYFRVSTKTMESYKPSNNYWFRELPQSGFIPGNTSAIKDAVINEVIRLSNVV